LYFYKIIVSYTRRGGILVQKQFFISETTKYNEVNRMNCRSEKCSGKIQKEKFVSLAVKSGGIRASAYPCNSCGLLYWYNNQPVYDSSGQLVYLKSGISR